MAKEKNQTTEAQETKQFNGPELAKRAREIRAKLRAKAEVSEQLQELIDDHRAYLKQDLSDKDAQWGRQHMRLLRGLLPED